MRQLTAAALVVVVLALGGCGARVPPAGTGATEATPAPVVAPAPAVAPSALDHADATLDEAERFLDALDQELAGDEG